MVRRIQRRMQVLQAPTVSDYVTALRQDPREADLLFRELLIGVTEFFRDPSAFAALQTLALPALLAGKGAADTLRVWVPGCATGEEAYSIAIAIKEVIGDSRAAPKVQIFATDINDRAIASARAGRFIKAQPGLSPERRQRWFVEEDEVLCVIKSLREMCIFSAHSASRDPPFSQLDLVSCRNLLIYMDRELQERLVHTFHYALKPGGALLLGPSEGLGHSGKLFSPLDKKNRLYLRGEGGRPQFGAHSMHHHDGSADSASHGAPALPRPTEDAIERRARRAMEKYVPVHVVIDANHQVLRSSGDTGLYLKLPSGAATLDLFALLQKGLRGVTRAAVQQAFAEQRTVIQHGVPFVSAGRSQLLRLVVEPLSEAADASRLCVVAFSEIEPSSHRAALVASAGSVGEVRQLEHELENTRAQWHGAIDQLETVNEEMKSANEEYQSVNEELQSANEELETSKEEMQSINEELHTVNAELIGKNESLSHANSDLRNLMESSQIATLFLDTQLHVTGFTPPATELYHLRESDRGRPITDITARIVYPELVNDVRHVMRTLETRERELRVSETGSVMMLRMLPYRTVDNVIDGVVLTFVDITGHKQREFECGQLAAIVEFSRDAIIGHSLDGVITHWNAGAARLFGHETTAMVGRPMSILVPDESRQALHHLLDSCAKQERAAETEMQWLRADGARVEVGLTCSPVKDKAGQVIAGSLIARDIGPRHQDQRHMQLMLGELNHRVKNSLATVQAIARQTLGKGEMQEIFLSRLMALSATHNLLAVDAWTGVGLEDIARAELAPFCRTEARGHGAGRSRAGKAARVRIVGEPLQLDAKMALSLSMGLHELATNALKYGALSVPEGRVVLQWETRKVEDQLRLTVLWSELDGPTVVEPVRRSFGSRLITEGLALELDGPVTLEFRPAGVVCTIDVPLSQPEMMS